MATTINYAPSLDCFSPNAIGVENAFEALSEVAALYFIDGELRELAFLEPASPSNNLLAVDLSSPISVRNAGDSLLDDASPSLYVDTLVVSPAMLADMKPCNDTFTAIARAAAPRSFSVTVTSEYMTIMFDATLSRPHGSVLNGLSLTLTPTYYATDDFSWRQGDAWPDAGRSVEDVIPRAIRRLAAEAVYNQAF